MFSKIKLSLRNINCKLFFALLVLGFVPSVYNTVRVFFLGQLPGEWAYSIAGQLSWVNLLYEILSEAIILPLFYFVGKVKHDKKEFANRIRTGMLISLAGYSVLSAAVFIFAEQLLVLMIRTEEENIKKKKALEGESAGNNIVNEIVRILSENVYGKISVNEICRDLSYSKTYVSKIFNENMGCTIVEYYTGLKIKEARKLIREKCYSFTEISSMLCFSNPHYFSKVFKKISNMSPREYLQSVTM